MGLFNKFSKQKKETEEEVQAESKPASSVVNTKELFQTFIKEDVRPNPSETRADDLFPLGAPDYEGTVAPIDSEHSFIHSTVCPVCGHTFDFPVVAFSKLRLTGRDDDMRRHYHNFEPLWYEICHCPQCYYTAPYSSFETAHDIQSSSDSITQAMKPYKEAAVLHYSDPRTKNEVLTSYYLSLRCADFYKDCYQIKAKVWLNLSWLYEDLGDEEHYMAATENAFRYYWLMRYHLADDMEPGTEQSSLLIMAELAIRLKYYRNAYDYLMQVIGVPDGKRIFKQTAQGKIPDILEMMHESEGN